LSASGAHRSGRTRLQGSFESRLGATQLTLKNPKDMVDARYVINEIQEMRDEGYLSDALLRYAVRTLHKSDPRHDWVGVYLLDADNHELWLHNYVGAKTEHAKIPVGTGVCGIAVAHGANQNVPDVTAFEGYLACNDDVKSELVVLIRAGSSIFGQIDIDSHQPAAFGQQDEVAIQMIADKLAEQIAQERR